MPRLSISTKLLLLLVSVPLAVLATLAAIALGTSRVSRADFTAQLEAQMRQQAASHLRQLTASRAQTINQRFSQIQAETAQLASAAGELLDHPQAFGAYWDPGRPERTAGGAYVTIAPIGDSSTLFVPNFVTPTAALSRTLAQSQFLDPLLRAVIRSEPEASLAYFNGAAPFSRVYPFADFSGLPPDFDARTFNFYYLADPQHNPGRGPVWTPAYVDPLGAGWVVTAAAPAYGAGGDFLGVAALDLKLTSLLSATAAYGVPETGAFAFLLGEDGTVLASPPDRKEVLGISELPIPEAIIRDESVLAGLKLTESRHQELAAATVAAIRPGAAVSITRVLIDKRPFFVATAPIPANGWTLGMMVPVDDAIRPLAALQSDFTRSSGDLGRNVLLGTLALVLATLGFGLLFARRLTAPLKALNDGAQAIAAGDFSVRLNSARRDELGQLSATFDRMAERLGAAQDEVLAAQNALERQVAERTGQLSERSGELAAALDSLQRSNATLLALSAPIIPVFDGILVAPIVGALDSERGAAFTAALLERVQGERSRVILIDVTGTTVLDEQAAMILLKAARAVELLGARTIMVGLRPEIAQTVVSLGVELGRLETSANLQSGLLRALRLLGRSVGAPGA